MTTGPTVNPGWFVLSELKAPASPDVCILCRDGLSGLPDAVTAVWRAHSRTGLAHQLSTADHSRDQVNSR
jgi:transposase-like protein